MDVQEPALFLGGRLNDGLYYGHKDKGYATEVVTTAEKPPPDGFRKIPRTTQAKRRARTATKGQGAEGNSKVLKPEEDQGYASILSAAGAKK